MEMVRNSVTKDIGFLEDDEVIRSNYTELLESDGYTVRAYCDSAEALDAFRNQMPDLALLDISLGDDVDGGLKVCRALREISPDLPIIFLTSHAHVDTQSRGWRAGADDYVTKDTNIELVLLRIRALLKRYDIIRDTANSSRTLESLDTSDLDVDEDKFQVSWRNTRLDLSLTQFWILRAVTKIPGQVVSHSDLQSAAKIVVEPNTIVTHVKLIRDEFKRVDPKFNKIKTERGRGYRWVE